MHATMMHHPMTVQMIMHHGARIHGGSRVRTFDGEALSEASFAEIAARAERLASALAAIGVSAGERVATLCWNHQAHLEAYLAVPSMGAVLHTLNLRLFPEQLAYVMNHAEDRVVLVDASLLELLEQAWPHLETVREVVVIGGDGGRVGGRAAHDYEGLIDAHPGPYPWPELDETAPAAACYTSGTTGNPKGVVYSHRTVFVHSLASMGADTFAISEHDRILLVPPMFHANSWGLPYSGFLAGSDMILPGPHLKPAHMRTLIERERPTFTAMVPTLMNDLLREHEREPLDLGCFRVIVSGGSAVAPALIDAMRETWGVPVLQGWGMTETSPLCCLSVPPRDAEPGEDARWRATAGRPVPGMQVRLADEDGRLLPEDGETVGELQLRGPWVTGSYHRRAAPESFSADGWLRTGDVGTIDPHGYVRITDRIKDVIKSGGEWISSVELENHLLAHPDVAEAAIVAVPHPRWEERPLGVVVPAAGRTPSPGALRAYLQERVARFWVPEQWSFVDALPMTGVGKIDKKRIRQSVDEAELDIVDAG